MDLSPNTLSNGMQSDIIAVNFELPSRIATKNFIASNLVSHAPQCRTSQIKAMIEWDKFYTADEANSDANKLGN